MVHSGHEPTAVAETFGSLGGLWKSARDTLFGPPRDAGVIDTVPLQPASPPSPLVTLTVPASTENDVIHASSSRRIDKSTDDEMKQPLPVLAKEKLSSYGDHDS